VLAFVKINGQPFHYFLLNIMQTLRRAPLRIWQKDLTNEHLKLVISLTTVPVVATQKQEKKELPRSRLADLSLVVNTGGIYHPDDEF